MDIRFPNNNYIVLELRGDNVCVWGGGGCVDCSREGD